MTFYSLVVSTCMTASFYLEARPNCLNDIRNCSCISHIFLMRWVSKWVVVVKCQVSFFQEYHGENKLIFNEMMMTDEVFFVVDQHEEFDFYSTRYNWHKRPLVDFAPHDTLSWFQVNQFLLLWDEKNMHQFKT